MYEYSKGFLEVISGPMFAGKTSELIRLYDRTVYGGQKSIIIKPKLDDRYSDKAVVTHNKMKRKSFVIKDIRELRNIVAEETPDNIFIDEAQFFDSSILDIIEDLRKKRMNVYCAILNQTSEGKPFPFIDKENDVGHLLSIADNIKIFTAVCQVCGKNATKTYKLESSGQEVDVGGENKYEPRCYEHWEPKK